MGKPLTEVEYLKDGRLIVWSPDKARELYNSGFFGKPLGLPKPKEDFDAPLILDLIEGVYLLNQAQVKVIVGEEKRELQVEELQALAQKSLEKFDEKYRVYKDLRNRGFIVTPGIKYGCDFAVYRKGPGIDHAPYIIQVKIPSDELSASEIVKAGRLATTVRKTFITALVEGEKIKYLGFKWWKP